MIDLFHLQLIKGNLTNTLNELKSYTGHVQVSIIPIIEIHQVCIIWAKPTPSTKKTINIETISNFFFLIMIFILIFLTPSSSFSLGSFWATLHCWCHVFDGTFVSFMALLFIVDSSSQDMISLILFYVRNQCLFSYLPATCIVIDTWQAGGKVHLIFFLEIVFSALHALSVMTEQHILIHFKTEIFIHTLSKSIKRKEWRFKQFVCLSIAKIWRTSN